MVELVQHLAPGPSRATAGPREKILVGPPNIFTGLLWEENF